MVTACCYELSSYYCLLQVLYFKQRLPLQAMILLLLPLVTSLLQIEGPRSRVGHVRCPMGQKIQHYSRQSSSGSLTTKHRVQGSMLKAQDSMLKVQDTRTRLKIISTMITTVMIMIIDSR